MSDDFLDTCNDFLTLLKRTKRNFEECSSYIMRANISNKRILFICFKNQFKQQIHNVREIVTYSRGYQGDGLRGFHFKLELDFLLERERERNERNKGLSP